MDVSEYRKRAEAELEAAAKTRSSEPSKAAALRTVRDQDATLERRSAALESLGRRAAQDPQLIDTLIEVAGDVAAPPTLRQRAIEILQGLAFLVAVFAPHRPRYHEMLRSIVEDRDPTLRRLALAILARYKDEFAQRRLVEGLERPSRALVPAAKAVQYLGYDIHAEHFPLLRRIVEKPPTAGAKREAIRLLAADPGSRALLRRLVNDKGETRAVRQMSALSLQAVAPSQFEKVAREISLDEAEDDRLRATTLGALARQGPPATTGAQQTFTRRVEEIGTTSASPQLRRASRSYVDRRSR